MPKIRTKKNKKEMVQNLSKNETVSDGQEITDKSLVEENKLNSSKDFSEIIKQIEQEYRLGYWFMKPKWDEWGLRLKLYNNQKRDKGAVGDPLLFTIHQTVLASLYDDRLSVEFTPRENGDDDICENLTDMAEYDYDEMEKDVADYTWDWDTSFFGRGLIMLMEFDRKRMCPVMENWSPMTTIRDPRAKSVNGDMRGRGRARFLGREIRMNKTELEDGKIYFNIDKLKPDNTDVQSISDRADQLRAEAQGYSDVSRFVGELSGDSATYRLLEWFTFYKGKLVLVTLGNSRKLVLRYTEFKTKKIPIIDRSLYPVSQDWDGVSIPDLVEDKQRARAKLANLGIKVAEAGLYPRYLFDSTRIKNKADLNIEFNKYVGVDGNPVNSITEIPRSHISTDVQYILNTLDQGAQKATATPDIQQGVSSAEKRTATELNLQSNKVDTRYSLSARIFGWSEKRFWQQWYALYKIYFKSGIDEKVIRLSGTLGATFRPLRRENIIALENDPDVKIESKVVADAKRFNLLQQFRGYLQSLVSIPTANIRFGLKYMGKLTGLKKDIINQLLPPTPDELLADDENKILEKNGIVNVNTNDDHYMHLEIHNKLSDTPAKYAHMQAHKKAMILLKQNPNIVPSRQSDINPVPPGQGIGEKPLANPIKTIGASKITE